MIKHLNRFYLAPQGYPSLASAYNGPAYPHRQLSREHSNEMKTTYPNKANNSYPVHEQVS